MDLNDYCKTCHSLSKEKGFWDKERNVGEMLMLIVSELGEAVEAHRHGDHGMKDNSFEVELADAFIRLFDMCGGLNIDIEKYIDMKMNINKQRSQLHGKKY